MRPRSKVISTSIRRLDWGGREARSASPGQHCSGGAVSVRRGHGSKVTPQTHTDTKKFRTEGRWVSLDTSFKCLAGCKYHSNIIKLGWRPSMARVSKMAGDFQLCLCVCVSESVYVYLCVCVSVCACVRLSVCISVCVCMGASVSVCVCLSVCLCMCVSLCLAVYVFVCVSVCQCVCQRQCVSFLAITVT